MEKKKKADRNKTLELTADEKLVFGKKLCEVATVISTDRDWFIDEVFLGDSLALSRTLPDSCTDLIIADPPYPGLRKQFGSSMYFEGDMTQYAKWLEEHFVEYARIMKPHASIYICGDWRGAAVIQPLLEKYFILRNRITWEREKGRGAKSNWKNSHEDIWFATQSENYSFNVDAVKILREVKAPYTSDGKPKDWQRSEDTAFRFTHPGNCWTDISVPFWSMAENTSHPTQKPEKLIAKLILASSNRDDIVYDPFLGSGSTAVTASKLGRRYCGVEREENYALLSLKRLEMAANNPSIQGVVQSGDDYIFLQRNTPVSLAEQVIKSQSP